MSYTYIKKNTTLPQTKKTIISDPKKKKHFAVFFFVSGILLFFSAVFPILRYQLGYATKFNKIINPLSTNFYNRSQNVLGSINADYTQLSNWFVDADPSSTDQKVLSGRQAQSYLLSIPKLKIQDAIVNVGSMDLKKSLVQYPQTALPGQLGNAVVFGHSVLPQFFNPKSYPTIFSTLFKLKQGDEILLNYDNIQYRYLIEEMYEVQPTDLSVLEQRFDGRYLTLITCTRPGTYLRRLIVRARIIDF